MPAPPALNPIVVDNLEGVKEPLETMIRAMEPGDNVSCALHRARIRPIGFNAHGLRFSDEEGQHHTLRIGVEHGRPNPDHAGKTCCFHLFLPVDAKRPWIRSWNPQNTSAVRQV